MRKLITAFCAIVVLTSCSSSRQTRIPGTEMLKSSQIFDILMDYQLYMWDKDSLSWHQPEKVYILNSTQPLYFGLFAVQDIKRKNDSRFSDSLIVEFKSKPIQIIEDVEQDFTEFILEENYTTRKLLIETTGRVVIDGVDFQMYSIRSPLLESPVIYVKYYNGIWKEYAPMGSIIRILE